MRQQVDKAEAGSKDQPASKVIKSNKTCIKCMSIQEILKSTDGNHIQSVTSIAVIFFIFGIIFTSIHGGRGAPLPPPEELLTTSTVPLENLSLAPGDFIILADSTPVPIESAHVSMNVPCQVAATAAAEGSSITTSTTANATQGPPSTDIKIMAGVEPDLKPAIPEYLAGLSRPENGKCTYHVQIPEVTGEPITGIAIVNTGNQTINFSSGNFATISTSTGGPLT